MGLYQRKIAEGVNFSCLATDKFKTNFLSFNFIAPLEAGSSSKNALIPAILMRGSKKYPTMADINKKLDYLYASSLSSRNQKRGEKQIFGICAGMIDSSYTIGGEDLISEVTELLGEILLDPVTTGNAFDTAYTESEKSNLIDAINANINDKAYYAQLRCVQEMCKNERFGLSEAGTVEEVSACTPESVYEQYKYALENYPIEIFFVGRCDTDKLCEQLSRLLSSIKRTPIAIPATEVIRTAGEPKTITEDMPVNQGKLTIGMRAGTTIHDADYPAMMLFNGIYGGAVTSKLFMNVREKMSLCYYCQSAVDLTKGLLFIQSGIEVKNREIAEKAIFDQLEQVKKGEFTEDECNGALYSIINAYRELADSARGLESWYLGRLIDGVDGEPDDVVARLSAVTRDEIIAAANKVSLDTIYFLNGTLKGEDENA
ncbi:MAG: insulinase family protein [Clostridiales bacterium]|nr:insulinase family protein [Clostridiales bacterium]